MFEDQGPTQLQVSGEANRAAARDYHEHQVVLGAGTPPCPYAIALRRERLREHWEARVQAVLRRRARRERTAVLVATVCGWISFSLVAVLFVNPPPTASWLYALWALALAILCAGSLREVRRLKATFPTPRMPPELDCDVPQK